MMRWIKADAIGLIKELQNLEALWREDPIKTDWIGLRELAARCHNAVDAVSGVSVAALALDGQWPDLFYEKFFAYLVEAGFDPYQTVLGEGGERAPALDQEWLLEMERAGSESARRMLSLRRRLCRRKNEAPERRKRSS